VKKKAGCLVVGAASLGAVAYVAASISMPVARDADSVTSPPSVSIANPAVLATPVAQVTRSVSPSAAPVPTFESAPATQASATQLPVAGHPITLTDANFVAEVLQSSKPVLVDFWAEWCQPCRAIAPIIQQLAHDFGDSAVVGKLDVDANHKVASLLKVQALPTLYIFKDGRIVDRIVGLASPDEIATRLARFVDQLTT